MQWFDEDNNVCRQSKSWSCTNEHKKMSKLWWLSNTWNLLLHSQINNELQIRKREVEAMGQQHPWEGWKKMQDVQEDSKETQPTSHNSENRQGNSFWFAKRNLPLRILPQIQQDKPSPKCDGLHKMAGNLWAIPIQLSWREIDRAEDLWMTQESFVMIILGIMFLIWFGWQIYKEGL